MGLASAPLELRWQNGPVDGDLGLEPLPDSARRALAELEAPPRLVAHHALVHDVSVRLARWCRERWPALRVDWEAVHFGAATHDVGKSLVPAELSGPGSAHEEIGRRELLRLGHPERLARFAARHGRPATEETDLEELLVQLSDKVWKGKRVERLEHALTQALARATAQETWEVFGALDEELGALAADADARLAWQARFALE